MNSPSPAGFGRLKKVVDEKATHWDLMKSTLNIFPIVPEGLHKDRAENGGNQFG